MVADGRIKAVQGSFARYEDKAVVLTGGETVAADVAVLATGWKLGVPFIPEDYRRKLIEPDGQYRLYRVIANPDLPEMGFVGFNSSSAPCCAPSSPPTGWCVTLTGCWPAKQASEAAMNENIAMMLDWKRNERPAAGVYGGLGVAPYHLKHFDELLDDIGATVRKRNPLAEKVSPRPMPTPMRAYLKSAPQYQAA